MIITEDMISWEEDIGSGDRNIESDNTIEMDD